MNSKPTNLIAAVAAAWDRLTDPNPIPARIDPLPGDVFVQRIAPARRRDWRSLKKIVGHRQARRYCRKSYWLAVGRDREVHGDFKPHSPSTALKLLALAYPLGVPHKAH